MSNRIQVKQMSDQFSVEGLVKVDASAIIETDFYTLVTDDIDRVCT